MVGARTLWDEEAENWVKWARTPDHDVFWYYAPSFFSEILPLPRGLTLEIGCGEGRVARHLAANGHNVVALDASSALVRFAGGADAQSAYISATGPALPFADATFQTVVAYNSLQTTATLEDMSDIVREAGRVIKPSGHFCLCVAHPMTDVDRGRPPAVDEQPPVSRSYFEHQCVNDTVTQGTLTMTFHGWTHTLEDYTQALESGGFAIDRIREPAPTKEQVAKRPTLERWRHAPLFLFVRAVRR